MPHLHFEQYRVEWKQQGDHFHGEAVGFAGPDSEMDASVEPGSEGGKPFQATVIIRGGGLCLSRYLEGGSVDGLKAECESLTGLFIAVLGRGESRGERTVSYIPSVWAEEPVEKEGKRLVFFLAPSGNSDFDVRACETLAEALFAIEEQAGVLEPADDVTFTVQARWLTPGELERERLGWAVE